MKKLLVFPFDTDHVELAKYIRKSEEYDTVLPVAMKGNDLIGRDIGYIDNEKDTGIIVDSDYKISLEQADAVFLDYSSKIKRNRYCEYIDMAVESGKKVIVSSGVEQLLNGTEYSSKVNHVCRYANYHYEPDKYKNLFRMRIPVIIVLGMGEYTGKFRTQLALGNFFSSRGYKVCEFGTREYSEILHMNTLPSFLFGKEFSIEEKVIALNRYFYEKISQSGCDLAIISMPGGIVPLNPFEFKDIGTLDFILSNAVKPDICVVNLYAMEANEAFLEYIYNICKYRLGYEVSYINMSTMVYSISPTEKEEFFYQSNRQLVQEYLHKIERIPEGIRLFCLENSIETENVFNEMLQELQNNIT